VRHLLVVALVGCGSSNDPTPPAPRPPALRGAITADSTIAARDYIGPDACGECHSEQHAQWRTSLHAVMNQRAEPAAVIGDFADVSLAYAGGTVTFGRDRTMTFERDGTRVRYRVTRTIGKQGLQEYVGIADGRTVEVRLPFGWWPRAGGWYPQPYFDPWLAELDVYTEVREPWAERCPWCHSTYPFAQRIARASRRSVGHGFEQFFEAPPGSDRLDVTQQVTVGISCESCHLGGRAHAAGAPIHLVPIGARAKPGAPARSTFAAERADPAIVNRVCAQCHSGPSPRFPDGAASRNSSEALDLAASTCDARCVDCHDPHTGGSDEARSLAACARCHPTQTDRAHSDHDAASCLDCHMPRIVLGIANHTRTHRIGSPSDPRMLSAATPNACNLCHLDQSLAWTAGELRRDYTVRLDPGAYPDDAAGDLWLASDQPAIRLIAAASYARNRIHRDLAKLLADPLPHVRAYATFAAEELAGTQLELPVR
jgi:hypothetical protein